MNSGGLTLVTCKLHSQKGVWKFAYLNPNISVASISPSMPILRQAAGRV